MGADPLHPHILVAKEEPLTLETSNLGKTTILEKVKVHMSGVVTSCGDHDGTSFVHIWT